jgi:hypothetical protein
VIVTIEKLRGRNVDLLNNLDPEADLAVEQSAGIRSEPGRLPIWHMGRSGCKRLSETALIVDPSLDFYRSGFSKICSRPRAEGKTETQEEMPGDVGMPGARPSHELFIPSLPPAELQSWR